MEEEHTSLISGMSRFPSAAGLRAVVRLVVLGLLYTGPASCDDVSVTVFSGETATLPCSAPYRISRTEVTVEWTKPGLEGSYLLMFRDGRLDPTLQLSSFKSRVDLADPELKNGNLSMILKNVTKNDEGLYECHFIDPTPRQKRAISDTKPIQTIDLKVKEQPGDEKKEGGTAVIISGIVGFAVLVVVLVVVVAVVVGVFVYCKKREQMVPSDEDFVPENASLLGSGSKKKRV